MSQISGNGESQQAMALLKAGKVEHTGDSHQKLVSGLNRGGLWSVTGPAQKIFLKTEGWFRQLTPNVDLQGLDLAGICISVLLQPPLAWQN